MLTKVFTDNFWQVKFWENQKIVMKSHYERGISDVESLLCKAPLTFSVRYLVCVVYAAFISLSLSFGEYQA